MCGRYTLTKSPEQIAVRFDAEVPADFQERYNAAPTESLPVLLDDGSRHVELLHWGLIPRWAKDASIGNRLINARAETISDKPAFREAFTRRRCLVLADGFFEWQKTASGKVPMRITLQDGELFAIAGLWESWKDPDGKPLRSFTIITTQANDVVAPIHDRMPVLLARDGEAAWLDNQAGPDVWHGLLQPYPADLMTAYPVSKAVNVPGNDSPAVIAPA